MAKDRTSFLCDKCGAVQAQWAGRCPECGAWDTLNPFIEPKAASKGTQDAPSWVDEAATVGPSAQPIGSIELGSVPRFATGIDDDPVLSPNEFHLLSRAGLVAQQSRTQYQVEPVRSRSQLYRRCLINIHTKAINCLKNDFPPIFVCRKKRRLILLHVLLSVGSP